jgi:hypothetical protein
MSVQTTSIGQQITAAPAAPAGEARLRKRTRATAGVVDDALN